jgi:hypothetical protein
MSVNAILEQNGLDIEQYEPSPTPVELFPRFERVRKAVASTLTQSPQGINTIIYGGVDTGFCDHNGAIRHKSCGVELQLGLKGVSFDNNRWATMEIEGSYVSPDGKRGYVKICIDKNPCAGISRVEAYWLQTTKGFLRIEQVVFNETTYNAGDFCTKDGANVVVPSHQKKTFPTLLLDTKLNLI